MPPVGPFVLAAEKLLSVLGPGSAVAGGMAVNAFGFARGTRDVDVITAVPLREARRRLTDAGIVSDRHKGDRLAGEFPCLKGMVAIQSRSRAAAVVPFDVLPELVPVGSEELDVRGHRLRVVDLDTLIRLKLKAGSVKDLYDVAILVHLHRGMRSRAESLAVPAPRISEQLAALIRDPRTRGQAREIKRQEKLLKRFRGL